MIKLDDIKAFSALSLLDNYNGANPYILKLKNEYLKNKKISLTENQSKYILDNHTREPLKINRVVGITNYLGEELKKQENLSFVPERILIEFILADTEKSYHIYGKLKRNQIESGMYFLPKTQVTDDPYFEPINVEVDFEKYNKKLAKEGKKLYNHQEQGIKFLLSRNGCILADDMGLGKVLANDTPVLTPYGWVKNGLLKVGDYVIGSNGKPTKILGVYPQPEKKFYNITLTDGTVIESCDEHLWAVQTTSQNKKNNGFVVKELKEIMNDLTCGIKGKTKWYLPIVKPVEFIKSKLMINPYIFGCILGGSGIISNDIINLVIMELNKHGLMGLNAEAKFIPNEYLYSDINDRIDLLQGLLDTNGYCAKDGTIKHYSVSKQLTNGIKEIVQSLGGVARQTSKLGRYRLPTGEIKICKECFILTINLPINIIPFKLENKIERLPKVKKYNPSRGIKSVKFSRKTTGQCIMVEAEDHLYVMDKYVVTHNTTQSIIAALETNVNKILVVCPSSAKINWEREISVFTKDVTIIDGKKWCENKFTIINYDILKNFHTLIETRRQLTEEEMLLINRTLANAKFDLIIIDEAHNLKNNDSIRGKIMVELAIKHNIPKIWMLTGTPVANRPMDFFNLLKIIKSPIAENWKHYAVRYCDARKFYKTLKNGKKRQIWLTDGASNLEELANKTKNIILRRLKTDVLDMPDKVITPTYHKLDIKSRRQYEQLWEEYLEKRLLEGKRNGNLQKELVELVLLRQFIAAEAIPHTIEMAENAIEMGKKVIIFTSFTEELEILSRHFGKLAVKHNGPMSIKEKQKSVDDFQNNPKIKVFIGNIKSSGVGITLTKATVVIFNSFDWVSGLNEQAEDRCYRIGQNNDVNVYYQIFIDTISTRMWETLKYKKDVISIIMGEQKVENETEFLIDKIIENEL